MWDELALHTCISLLTHPIEMFMILVHSFSLYYRSTSDGYLSQKATEVTRLQSDDGVKPV